MSIPLHLVTGFLGSGKTSFLKHYLSKFGNNQKIAIVQNEFAPTGVDGGEFRLNNQVLEINNGSAFCVCLLGSFKQSLAKFIEEVQPDEILMEASGLSDPIGVGQIFQAPELKNKVYLEHVWCLFDAVNFEKTVALKNKIDHQIRIADTVIINKKDLYKGDIQVLIKYIEKTNPFSMVKTACFGKVELSDFKRALSFFPINEKDEGRPALRSEVIKTAKAVNEIKLRSFLDSIKKNCIRFKGFVKIENNRSYSVQGVFESYELSEVDSKQEPTELVIICDQTIETNFQKEFEKWVS